MPCEDTCAWRKKAWARHVSLEKEGLERTHVLGQGRPREDTCAWRRKVKTA